MPRAAARHILVKTKSEAEKLKQQLANGADFGTLAKKHSLCASAKQGGDLGEFSLGKWLKHSIMWYSKNRFLLFTAPSKRNLAFI